MRAVPNDRPFPGRRMAVLPMPASPAETRARMRGCCRAILTPDHRLRVFVSSTLLELAPERAAVERGGCSTLRLTPVMFELGARPHPPQELYRSYLEQSDVFVGIYWESYGWIAPGRGLLGNRGRATDCGRAKPPTGVHEGAGARARAAPRRAPARSSSERDGVSYKTFTTAEELGELVSQDLALLVTERFSSRRGNGRERQRCAQPARRSTSFVGRGNELVEVEKLLDAGARLVTITAGWNREDQPGRRSRGEAGRKVRRRRRLRAAGRARVGRAGRADRRRRTRHRGRAQQPGRAAAGAPARRARCSSCSTTSSTCWRPRRLCFVARGCREAEPCWRRAASSSGCAENTRCACRRFRPRPRRRPCSPSAPRRPTRRSSCARRDRPLATECVAVRRRAARHRACRSGSAC